MGLYKLTAAELHEKLVNKECSAVEIAKSVLERMEKCEPVINAYVTRTSQSALEQAARVDAKIAAGEEIAPLEGIPVAVKDNICTKGVLTTCSSKMLYNFVPPYDATVVEKLKAAGCVQTGKCNMDEFAMGSSCETSYFGCTRNPWDTSKVPGGSSGGSAAAVAAGEAILSLGSDTGGSIRQPASLCGVIGLKPTYGAVSRYGLVAFASSLDQIGPIGRCAKDVAELFQTISGHDRMDATHSRHEYGNFADSLGCDLSSLRIGVPKEYFGSGVESEVKESVMALLKEYESRGAKLVEISLPSTDFGLSAYYIISSAEASSNLARFDGVKYGYRAQDVQGLTDMYERTRSEGFGDEVKRRIMLGTFVLSSGFVDAYYKKAKLLQKEIRREFDEAFGSCDVIATPTSPSAAFGIGENFNDPLKMYAADICTITVNIAGLPAVSLPCGKVGGMPIGMQLIGKAFSEEKLLGIVRETEKLRGALCEVADSIEGVPA